jgi:hypothetical protein
MSIFNFMYTYIHLHVHVDMFMLHQMDFKIDMDTSHELCDQMQFLINFYVVSVILPEF